MFLHFTQQEGLPSNTIYDIYRDSKGFMWFGTNNGVVRFNGIHFEKFSTFDGLPDNEIFFFQEDYSHRLWMSTFNGQLCYYKDGIFHNSENTNFLKLTFKTSDTKFIKLHSDSSVSIAFFNQPNFFINIKDECLRRIDIKAQKNSDIRSISKTGPDKYEIFTDTNYMSVDTNGNILQSNLLKKQYRFSYGQDSLYLYDQNNIYNAKGQYLSPQPVQVLKNITRIQFTDGKALVCTMAGIYLGDKLVLPNQKISAVTRDISGNYWIGTLNGGVYVLKHDYADYHSYRNVYSGTVKYSTKYNGRLLFSTSALKLYEHKNAITTLLSDYNKTYHLSKEEQFYAAQYIDSTNFYYFSAIEIFTASIAEKNKISRHYTNTYSTPKLIAQRKNRVYLLSSTHISYIAPNEKNYTRIPIFTTDKNARLFWMAPDSNGNIWYAGTNNIYKVTGGHAIPQSQFAGLQLTWFDIYGNRMIGITNNNRLVLVKNIQKEKIIYSVIRDNCTWNRAYLLDSLHILISTDKLYRLITLSDTGKEGYTLSIIDNEFIPRDVEYITTGNNTVYFFENGNIHTVSIKSLLSGTRPPVVWASRLKSTRNQYPIQLGIQIPYKEAQNITIEFKTLSYETRHIRYEYSISKDEDTFWHTTQNEDINIYTPAFGTYKVSIRAVTESGIAGVPFSFSFTVLKPFYATWWFIISSSIFFIALTAIAMRLRIKSLLNKREREHEIKIKFLKSEYKALNALMNPHFIFNSLNNIQGFINKGNKTSANIYLNTFSKLVRQNMHNVSKETIVLQEEIDLIQHYLVLEKMRFKDMFNYDIDINDNVDVHDIFIPPLLIQPFIENAIKHGLLPNQPGNNMLWIRFYAKENLLHVEVEDNGIGFNHYPPTNLSHTSYAFTNIRMRVGQLNEMHNNAIHLQIGNRDNNLNGTKVTITLNIDAIS